MMRSEVCIGTMFRIIEHRRARTGRGMAVDQSGKQAATVDARREELRTAFGRDAVMVRAFAGTPDGPSADLDELRPRDEREAAEIVRWAADRGVQLLPLGAGTQWIPSLQEGAEPLVVSATALSGVVEYDPGDLVMVVRSGTPLAEIERVAGEHGQWLPVDPLVSERATLGGVIGTAAAGPHRLGYGPLRDWVIGLRAVTADGPIRAGGKVVKNVAGYDVTKLFIGSQGSLGLVTEAAIKLRPLPPERRLLAFKAPDVEPLQSFARELMDRSWSLSAAEWINPALAEACGLPKEWIALLGTDELPKAAQGAVEGWRRLAREHGLEEIGAWAGRDADDLWSRYGNALGGTPALRLRWVMWPSQVPGTALHLHAGRAGGKVKDGPGTAGELASSLREESTDRLFVSGGLGTGEVRAAWILGDAVPEEAGHHILARIAAVTEAVRSDMGRVRVERVPFAWRKSLLGTLGSAAESPLSRRVKEVLDPGNVFVSADFVGGV